MPEKIKKKAGRPRKNEINRKIDLRITTKSLNDKINDEVGDKGCINTIVNERLKKAYGL